MLNYLIKVLPVLILSLVCIGMLYVKNVNINSLNEQLQNQIISSVAKADLYEQTISELNYKAKLYQEEIDKNTSEIETTLKDKTTTYGEEYEQTVNGIDDWLVVSNDRVLNTKTNRQYQNCICENGMSKVSDTTPTTINQKCNQEEVISTRLRRRVNGLIAEADKVNEALKICVQYIEDLQ